MNTVSVNDVVRVNLTPAGEEVYKEYTDELTLVLGREVAQRLTVLPDALGMRTFALYDLMRIFGRRMGMYHDPPFVDNKIVFP